VHKSADRRELSITIVRFENLPPQAPSRVSPARIGGSEVSRELFPAVITRYYFIAAETDRYPIPSSSNLVPMVAFSIGTDLSVEPNICPSIHQPTESPKDNLEFSSEEPIYERINSRFSKRDWIIVGAEAGH
jgi:hypothetical protein